MTTDDTPIYDEMLREQLAGQLFSLTEKIPSFVEVMREFNRAVLRAGLVMAGLNHRLSDTPIYEELRHEEDPDPVRP